MRKFQKANNLDADGVAGAKTLNKITAKITGVDPEDPDNIVVTPSLRSNYGRTTKDKVNVRKSPGGAGKTLLKKDTYFKINTSTTSGNYVWYNITFTVDGYTSSGYIRSDMVYVLTKNEAENYIAGNITGGGEVIINGYVKVTGDNVRLREDASTDAGIKGTAKKGEVYPYIATKKDSAGKTWYGLKVGSWIREDYVTTKVTDDEISDSSNGTGDYRTLKRGMSGTDVKNLQLALRKLGYYGEEYSISGTYGLWTAEAVRQFQLDDKELDADAIAGPKTQAAIFAKLNSQTTTNPNHTLDGTTYYNVDYFANKAAIVKAWGSQLATIYDITSGKQWNVKHLYHGNHFDVEPATAADTAVMCQAYGVSIPTKINTERRAVLLTIGKQTFCGSMYGVGHGDDTLPNNGYDGQFCIHLLGSKLNGGDSGTNTGVDPKHKAKIEEAYNWVVKNKGVTPKNVYP